MSALLITVHIIVCIALIMIVLLQTGKGADMGAAFGGGGSQTLFGSTGASTFLTRATTWAAIIFMFTCLALAYISSRATGSSIMKDVKAPAAEQTETAPAAEKTEAAPTASPLQTSVETKPAGEEKAAETKETSAQPPVSESSPPAAPESATDKKTSETGENPQPAPAAAPPVTEEGKTEQN